MDYRTEASTLVARLGEHVGNPELVLNTDGQAAAEIKGIPFSFFYESGYNALFIQAALGCPTPEALEDMMRRNQLWGGTAGGIFGLNPDDGIVYYSYRLDFPIAEETVYPEFLCDLMAYIVGAIEVVMDDLTPKQPICDAPLQNFNPMDRV